jgi:hypothetical protein
MVAYGPQLPFLTILLHSDGAREHLFGSFLHFEDNQPAISKKALSEFLQTAHF